MTRGDAHADTGNDHRNRATWRFPFLMYGVLLIAVGIASYLFGVILVVPRYLLGMNRILLPFDEWIVWYSGVPVIGGAILVAIDLLLLIDRKRRVGNIRFDVLPSRQVVVALTAYNDEASVPDAVRDFLRHPAVKAVILVSNNSTDRTEALAAEAGAVVFNEKRQGYGWCVFRALQEAIRFDATNLIVLCEADMTFRAFDLDKLLAYAPHADIVNGTRTVERLRGYHTQLSTFMYYGNLFTGKLLEAKHLGMSTITDVGTTYKLCRRTALETLLPLLDPSINLEFNAHFLDTALGAGLFLVESPITFHRRVGLSKGGNANNWRAMKVGLRMLLGIVVGWGFVPR